MRLYLFILTAFVCCPGWAQNKQGNFFSKTHTEDWVYIDSARNVFSHQAYQLMMQSGHYSAKKIARDTLLLTRRTAEQMARDTPPPSQFFTTGTRFHRFTEEDVNGNTIDLADLKGKVVVLLFWYPNIDNDPRQFYFLNQLVESYNGDEVKFIAIAKERLPFIRRFLNQVKFNYEIIPNAKVLFRRDAVSILPTHVVLDKQGKIIFHTSFYRSGVHNWISAAIKKGLEG